MRVVELPYNFTIKPDDVQYNLERLQPIINSFVAKKNIPFKLTSVDVTNKDDLRISGIYDTIILYKGQQAKANINVEFHLLNWLDYILSGYKWVTGERFSPEDKWKLDFAIGNKEVEIHVNGNTLYGVNPEKWQDGTLLRIMYIFYNYLKVVNKKIITVGTNEIKGLLNGKTLVTKFDLSKADIMNVNNYIELKQLIYLTSDTIE